MKLQYNPKLDIMLIIEKLELEHRKSVLKEKYKELLDRLELEMEMR